MSRGTLAIFAAIGTTTIYGPNHTIAKEVMPHYVQPLIGIVYAFATGQDSLTTLKIGRCHTLSKA